MTCRLQIAGILGFCMLMLGCIMPGQQVLAAEQQLPEGDILIVYSDDATMEDRDKMMLLVENLTYQNYQVTYVPASDCLGHLKEFKSILFYKVERYPGVLVSEVYEREKEGNRIMEEREVSNISGVIGDVRLFFIGNRFLREYLQQTGRATQYLDADTHVARLEYAFSSASVMASLVKEDDFLFLKKTLDTYGSIEAAGTEGYFVGKQRVICHIPLTNLEEPLIRATVFREISKWMWREAFEQYTYAQYIVLEQVYPFQNPEHLLTAVKKIVDLEQPFIITVMPLYEHGDYPAMQQFCEVLRFAQANDGMIMIHTPLNQMPEFDAVQVNEALATAVGYYVEQGVYPMGLQIPRSWMFRQDTLEVMGQYKTILVAQESDRLIYSDVDANTNADYLEEHQWIAPAVMLDTEGISYLTNYSSAVYFDVTVEEEEFDKRLKACMESEVPLKNLMDANHEVRTNEDEIIYRNGYLTVNGENRNLDYEPGEYPEEFDYKRNMLERVSKDLTGQNQKLIFAVVTVSILFVAFILIARYRSYKRFFYRGSDNPWEQDDEALIEQFERQLENQSANQTKKQPEKKVEKKSEKQPEKSFQKRTEKLTKKEKKKKKKKNKSDYGQEPVLNRIEVFDFPIWEVDDYDIKDVTEQDDFDIIDSLKNEK